MPYLFEKNHIRLPRDKDRRIRLTDSDKEDIVSRYKKGEAIRSIARVYEVKCTRRVIQYVVRPDLYQRMSENAKERRKQGLCKPDREKWAKTMREHRRYKQSVLKGS